VTEETEDKNHDAIPEKSPSKTADEKLRAAIRIGID
jgi:hypothetical protein